MCSFSTPVKSHNFLSLSPPPPPCTTTSPAALSTAEIFTTSSFRFTLRSNIFNSSTTHTPARAFSVLHGVLAAIPEIPAQRILVVVAKRGWLRVGYGEFWLVRGYHFFSTAQREGECRSSSRKYDGYCEENERGHSARGAERLSTKPQRELVNVLTYNST